MSGESQRKLYSAERALLKNRVSAPVAETSATVIQTDNSEILAAIADLKQTIEKNTQPQMPDDMPEMSVLRGQLHELRDSIEKTKREIAAMRSPGQTDDRLMSAAMELDAIVGATEVATHNILSASEDINDAIFELKDRIGDVAAHQKLDDMANMVMKIFENCNFQDITGQRTGKVVKTIDFLEDRIMTMINIWGEEEFHGIEVTEEAQDEDEKLLQGPQLDGQGVSQDDIDALFD